MEPARGHILSKIIIERCTILSNYIKLYIAHDFVLKSWRSCPSNMTSCMQQPQARQQGYAGSAPWVFWWLGWWLRPSATLVPNGDWKIWICCMSPPFGHWPSATSISSYEYSPRFCIAVYLDLRAALNNIQQGGVTLVVCPSAAACLIITVTKKTQVGATGMWSREVNLNWQMLKLQFWWLKPHVLLLKSDSGANSGPVVFNAFQCFSFHGFSIHVLKTVMASWFCCLVLKTSMVILSHVAIGNYWLIIQL